MCNGEICDIALKSKDPLISRKTKWIVSAPKELCLTNSGRFSAVNVAYKFKLNYFLRIGICRSLFVRKQC